MVEERNEKETNKINPQETPEESAEITKSEEERRKEKKQNILFFSVVIFFVVMMIAVLCVGLKMIFGSQGSNACTCGQCINLPIQAKGV